MNVLDGQLGSVMPTVSADGRLHPPDRDSITHRYQAATIPPVITEIQEHNVSDLIAGFT